MTNQPDDINYTPLLNNLNFSSPVNNSIKYLFKVKILILFFVVVLITIASAYYFVASKFNPKEVTPVSNSPIEIKLTVKNWPPTNVSQCNRVDIPDSKTQSDCYTYMAVQLKDKSLCNRVISNPQDCLLKVSYVINPLETCLSMTKETDRNACLFGMVNDNPNSSFAITACENINCIANCYSPSDSKEYCFDNVAVYRKDISLCDRAGKFKDSCVTRVNNGR